MRQKLRTEVKVKGYHFLSKPGLIWHSGKFWLNEEPAKLVFNNGSNSINYFGSKISIKKLRKEAQPCTVTIIDSCPF